MNFTELKDFLDEKVELYNRSEFIESDPIQIPHRFEIKEDIEIAAFFAANMAWGNRKMIINKLNDLMNRMGNSPFDFVMNYSEDEFEKIEDFKHRTMNSVDIDFMLRSLQNIYKNHNGLEATLSFDPKDEDKIIQGYDEMGKAMQDICKKHPAIKVYSFVTEEDAHAECSRVISKLRDIKTDHQEFMY